MSEAGKGQAKEKKRETIENSRNQIGKAGEQCRPLRLRRGWLFEAFFETKKFFAHKSWLSF